jgi:hypothetical protein
MNATYTFKASNGTSVTMLRGDGAAKMTGGGGGWSVEARPRRVGLTLWQGRDPYRMEVPILFDGWASGRSQENAISILNQMQMGANFREPPTVTIDGVVPVKNARWVIDSIEWGDDVIVSDDHRLRQDAIVRMIQYTPVETLSVRNKGQLRATPKPYIVKKGDTFKSISKAHYGTPDKWRIIMAANNIRDPQAIKRLIGKAIRIP